MLFREQELSLQKVLSLSPVHLCGTPQIFDLRLTLLVTRFLLLLLSNFIPFLL